MQITFTVKDKIVKTAIENALDCNVFEYFDSATLKAAKLPKMATLVKTIFEDAKFQKELTKAMAEAAEASIEDCIYDDLMYEIRLPLIDDLVEQCEQVSEQTREQAEQEREAAEVARMVKTLERAGFKIVKA